MKSNIIIIILLFSQVIFLSNNDNFLINGLNISKENIPFFYKGLSRSELRLLTVANKNQLLKNKEKIYFLGGSSTREFYTSDEKVYNLGSSSQSHFDSLKIIDGLPKNSKVILGLTPFQLLVNLMNQNKDDYTLCKGGTNYAIPFAIKDLNSLNLNNDQCRLFYNQRESFLYFARSMAKIIQKPKLIFKDIEIKQHRYPDGSLTDEKMLKRISNIKSKMNISIENLNIHLSQLYKIINHANNKNIELIIVPLPVNLKMQKHFEKEIKLAYKTFEKVSNSVEYRFKVYENEEFFYDQSHLNSRGRLELSKKIK